MDTQSALDFTAWLHEAIPADEPEPAKTAPPPPPTPVGPPMVRWFVRCTDCLSIAAVDLEKGQSIPMEYGRAHRWQCDACEGPIEVMGQVERGRLVRAWHEAPCDDRCTNARGPHCDCSCGGKNHGSRIVVRVTQDVGAIPRVQMLAPITAKARAAEYRTAREALRAELNTLLDRKRTAGWLSSTDFARLRQLQKMNQKIDQARTHAGRMKTLTTR